MDADGYAVPDATICVKDDTDLGSGETVAILTTDADGLFLAYWPAERRPAGGSWDFYAAFEGTADLSGSRSDAYTVDMAEIASAPQPAQPLPGHAPADDSGRTDPDPGGPVTAARTMTTRAA